MKFLIILFLFSFSVTAQENEESVDEVFNPEIEKEIMKNQYVLRFNQMINKECRIVIYMNQDHSSLIMKSFSTEQEDEFKNLINKPELILDYVSESFNLAKTLKGLSKNHIFTYKNNDIYVKYNLFRDETLRAYDTKTAIIFKKPVCR